MRVLGRFFQLFLFAVLLSPPLAYNAEWDEFSAQEREILGRILAHWETWVPQMKKEGRAPLMTFDELYQGLGREEKGLLDRVRSIRPEGKTYLGMPDPDIVFKKIEGQEIRRKGKPETVDPQYLPAPVYKTYERMMRTMEKDLGRRLYVESGYRSPAYQLYTFLFYLPGHGYSIAETRRWVALPGYSEHGAPHRQAIDFINEDGVNGDDPPQTAEDFERLPEYAWLQVRARDFGFELSYPRGAGGTTYEPWHWRTAENN